MPDDNRPRPQGRPARKGDRRETPPPRQTDEPGPPVYGERYEEVLRPIVFVPGILGSEIMTKDGSRSLWPPYYSDGSGHFQYAKNIKDLYRLPASQRKAVGPFPTVYTILVEFLKSLRGAVNFHPFWYDWTQSNAKNGELLAAHIRAVLNLPRYQGVFTQVDLVCHSMGGLITRAACVINGATGQIRRAAYLASPHFGAPKAYFAVHPDIPLRMFDSGIMNFVLELAWDFWIKGSDDEDDVDEALRDLASHMDSVYELMPDRYFFLGGDFIIEDNYPAQRFPIRGLEATYYHGVWQFKDSKVRKRVEDAMKFKDRIGNTLPHDPAQTLVVYSQTDPTNDRIEYDHVPPFYEFESPFASTPANGDATVPATSSTMHRHAPNLFSVPGEHVALASSGQVRSKLYQFLQAAPP